MTVSERQERFLNAYQEAGTIFHAAKKAGVDRSTHYKWLADEGYKTRFDHVRDDVADELEHHAIMQAKSGEAPAIMIFLLKALRPGKFNPSHKVELKADASITPTPELMTRLALAINTEKAKEGETDD